MYEISRVFCFQINKQMCLHKLHNKKKFFRLFVFVNWASQMSSSQTGPKKSQKSKVTIFNFFYCIAYVAKGGG